MLVAALYAQSGDAGAGLLKPGSETSHETFRGMHKGQAQMKIYFAGSIRAGRGDQELYQQLIQGLQKHGPVLTEHIGDPGLTQFGDDGPSDSAIYERDMAWLDEADLVVAEVSTPSLGVGYEIGRAELLGKPVICLFRPGPERWLSAMISGNPRLTVENYETVTEALAHAGEFIRQAAGNWQGSPSRVSGGEIL